VKVNIKIEERSEKVSMFKSMSIHVLRANVELNEEEKAAIQQLKLADYTLINEPLFLPIDIKTFHGEAHRAIPVSNLLKGGVTLSYPDPIHAQNGMTELKQQLTNLKEMLNRADSPNEDSFEL
jgi:hypothetical protein